MSTVQVIRGTRYRKWKSPTSAPNSRRSSFAGSIHIQYFVREANYWKFVCGKRDNTDWGVPGDIVDSESTVTCEGCKKQAPEIVEKMDRVPDLEEFQ